MTERSDSSRVALSAVLVVFGATGDLANRKLFPALSRLGERNQLPQRFAVIGVARTEMSDELQALCFFAGANSIFYGDKLLTTENPQHLQDRALLARLGMRIEGANGAVEVDSLPLVPAAGPGCSAGGCC